MSIKKNLIVQGNFLFRYRSYFPIILFVLAIPFMFYNNDVNLWTAIESYVIALSLLVSIAGFFIRGYAIGTTPKGTSGRNTKQQVAEQLNTSGIYSVVRHPLYLGNYLIWLGIVIFTSSIYFIIIFSLLFWLYYERIMAAEEDFIETKFGQQFTSWAEKTPAFWPSFKNYNKSFLSFSFKTVLRREYSGFLATVISYAYIDYMRCFFTYNKCLEYRISLLITLIAIVLTLILRTLKHHTTLLHESERS